MDCPFASSASLRCAGFMAARKVCCWLYGCPFASSASSARSQFTKGYSLLRSRRIRRTVALEPIFPLVARVSLWR